MERVVGPGAYEGARGLSRGRFRSGIEEMKNAVLAPDDAFLVEEVIDHFDAITHLDLGLFGHGEDGTDQLA
jgi:hypothetical protein